MKIALLDDDVNYHNLFKHEFKVADVDVSYYLTPHDLYTSGVWRFDGILVDHNLGAGVKGNEVIDDLKPKYPNIEFALISTTGDIYNDCHVNNKKISALISKEENEDCKPKYDLENIHLWVDYVKNKPIVRKLLSKS